MGSIKEYLKKDGTCSYQAEVRMKGYKPQRDSFRTRTKAKQWIQQTESAIRDGRYVNVGESRRRTLKELIDRFTTEWLPRNSRGEKKQAALLSWWAQEYGHRLLIDVTLSMIAEGRDKLLDEITIRKTKRSPSTVNRYLCALAKALTIAVKEWGWVDDTPMRKVTKLKEAAGRDRFLSVEERDRLLLACKQSKNPILYDLVILSLICGARYSELTMLRWEDVDFETGRVVFRETKNGDDRYIPLTDEIRAAFERLKPIDSNLSGRIFVPFANRKNKDRQINVRGAFAKALRDASIEGCRWHDLRHTAASYMAMNGATQGELQEILGHRSVVASARYRHFSQQHLHGVLSNTSVGKI